MASASNGLSEPLRLPLAWMFGALAAGAIAGWALAGTAVIGRLLPVTETIGTLWLHALQMTILPLVASLLVTGLSRMVETARAGATARRTVLAFIAVLAGGTLVSALAMPALLAAFPIPEAAQAALTAVPGQSQEVPGIAAFMLSLVSPNLVAAAAENAMLPLIVFFALLALAIARLPADQRDLLVGFFAALGNAMLIVIGWILRLAPIGIFALAVGVAARSGGEVFAALGHYIAVVASMGLVVLLGAYALAVLVARRSLPDFEKAALPAQSVALSTQSSLASLPAMLAACRKLGVGETTAEFVLPLAVAVFRATSPGMNLAVAIYVAKLTGVALTPQAIAAGAAVALLTTVGSVSLPGTISFIASTGPIALSMGVPLGPLALLVAVEMLPDMMRTLGNVTMDIAVTASVDQAQQDN